MPKLFFDYIGMGDSDKPKEYAYSTAERTDLVEAIWRDLSVQSTTLVAFDFSSLVVLEHLRRRLERSQWGEAAGGPNIRGVLIFNGGLFTDGLSHPWYTTPMLRRLPNRARWGVGRHDGLFYLAAAAGFVADQKAQGDRLDFGHLFEAYRDQFPFLLGGSNEDPFEHRQVDLAQERLGKLGLTIERLPGGHLTTNEQPCSNARTAAVLLPSRTSAAFGFGAFLGALAAFLARVAFLGLAALGALGLPPLALFWRLGAPLFALAAFFEEAFSGATVAPCSATAAVSVVAAFWVVIFVGSPSAVVTAVRTSITPVPPECKWILPAIDDGESSAMERRWTDSKIRSGGLALR
jgi:pimeloyl-ACP methyl ester carboxylesterase